MTLDIKTSCGIGDPYRCTIHFVLRARLHQASGSTLRPLCDDASDSVLIEINGRLKMGCKPILEHHCRVVATLTLTLGVNGPLTLVIT